MLSAEWEYGLVTCLSQADAQVTGAVAARVLRFAVVLRGYAVEGLGVIGGGLGSDAMGAVKPACCNAWRRASP